MHREHRSWWSPSLGRQMDLLVFGHAGTPLLAFPSSLGRYYEWEDFGMIEALSAQVESGHNTVICVDSVDAESLYNRGVHPSVRIARHEQYQQYIFDEVLPFARHHASNDFVIAAGASFGAYHAANVVFRRPHEFGKLIALSGAFDVKPFMDGFYDQGVYFNNPVDFIPNIDDHDTLEAIRQTDIILTLGEYDPCREANYRLHHILEAKGIPHRMEVAQGAFGHDWPWWTDLIRKHIA